MLCWLTFPQLAGLGEFSYLTQDILVQHVLVTPARRAAPAVRDAPHRGAPAAASLARHRGPLGVVGPAPHRALASPVPMLYAGIRPSGITGHYQELNSRFANFTA